MFSAARAEGKIEGLEGDDGLFIVKSLLFASAFLNGIGAAIIYVA